MPDIKLIRTTIRILPSQNKWLEQVAKEKQRTFAEVLRECLSESLRMKTAVNAGSYISRTVPKAVYLGQMQLDQICAHCKTHGGTMSGFVRFAIDTMKNATAQ